MRQTNANRPERAKEEVKGTSGTLYRLIIGSDPFFKGRGFIDENHYINYSFTQMSVLMLWHIRRGNATK